MKGLGKTRAQLQHQLEQAESLVARLEADSARLRDAEQRTHQVAESLLAARLALTRTLDLNTTLETLLDHLGELVPYDSASIFLLEGDTHLVARAARGYERWLDREAAQVIGAVRFDIGDSPRHRALVTTQESCVIEDTRQDPNWKHVASCAHVRSWMGVPLVAGGETIGLYSLDKTEPSFFTPEHLRWAEGLAAQAAIALQNALLYHQAQRELAERQQAQRAEHEQRVLAEALRDIAELLNSSLDLDKVFEGILTHVARVVPSQVGSILLIKGDVAEVIRVRGYDPSVVGVQLPLESPTLCRAMKTGHPAAVDDTRTDDGWVRTPESHWIRSNLTAAIRSDEEVIGFLCLDCEVPSAFSPEHVERLEAFANQAGTAVRNARLFAEIERQKQYSESLVQNSPVAIVTTDRHGCIASWNPAAESLFGYSLAQAIGQDLDSLVADPSTSDIRDVQQAKAYGRFHTIAQRCREDGSLVDVEVFALPLGADQEQRCLFIYHDLTELKQAERQLEQAKEAAEATTERIAQELALAGEVQISFLPHELPDIPGWQLAVTLMPAGETSGDFYDIHRLPNGRLALLIADVVGKGVSAALYMALIWTLLRTLAAEHPTRPDLMIEAANRRILSVTETRADQFATVFYGILDPATGTLAYCNAGHCPSLLLRAQNGVGAQELEVTGAPIGLFANETWEQRVAQLAPGDGLVLYTDGVTEARNEQGEFFDEDRLMAYASAHLGHPAHDIRDAILGAVHEFVGDGIQRDDIALTVVVRDAT